MRPNAFPPALRVRRKSDFDRIFREGSRASDERLAVHVRPNEGEHSRLGLAVSRHTGGAVVRNLVKRRLREVFRLHRTELPGSFDYVVTVRSPAAAECAYATLEKSFLDTARGAVRRWERVEAKRRGAEG